MLDIIWNYLAVRYFDILLSHTFNPKLVLDRGLYCQLDLRI